MARQTNIVEAGTYTAEGEETIPYAPVSELQEDATEPPESDREAEGRGPDENWTFWQQQITTALTQERRWRKEAQHAEALFFGREDDVSGGTSANDTAALNEIDEKTALIHANIEVLKPLVFSETPTPVVQRRWRGDGKSDPTDLMAAEAAQRLAQWFLSTSEFDVAMERARDDWLIPGRGAARVMYRAEFAEQPTIDPGTGMPAVDPVTGMPVTQEVKSNEEVLCVPVEWRRLVLAPAHSWEEMPWLAFEVPMTRTKIEKRFPEACDRFSFNQKGLAGQSRGVSDQDRDERFGSMLIDRSGEPVLNPFDTATVWEIWVKETKQVVWWSPDCTGMILDKIDDPLNLEQFYPMPKPLLATTRGNSMNPRPDTAYYEARAKEIETATRKMRRILEAISVSGLFPGTMADEVHKLLSGNNELIPVKSWIALMEKGGTGNIIQWLPLDAMIAALNALSMMREASKQAMFEASGVSDIMRAQGDPTETATAQNLKGKYAGMRLSVRQRRMALYARDMLRIMVEIGVEMFDTAFLAELCGLELPMTKAEREAIAGQAQAMQMQHAAQMQQYQAMQQAMQGAAQQQGQQVDPAQLPPPPPEPELPDVPDTSWEEVHDRLRNDLTRKISINIETSSTILADEAEDKQARVEFLSAFSTFISELMPLLQTGEFDMKVVKELLLFGIRGFPKSRTLESMIAHLPDEPKASPPPEDPTVTVAKIRAQVDLQIAEMRAQVDSAKMQVDLTKAGATLAATTAGHALKEPKSPPQAA